MDKKSILGITVAVAGLIGWQIYFTKQQAAYDAYVAAQRAEAERIAAVQAKSTTPAAPGTTAAPGVPGAPVEATPVPVTPPVEPKLEKLQTSSAEYVFTNLGGGIARATLKHHVIEKKNSELVVLNEFGKIPVGAITDAAGEKTDAPFTSTSDPGAGVITFERVDERQLALTKKFTLPRIAGLKGKDLLREEYRIQLDVTFTNRGTTPIQLPKYWVHTGSSSALHPNDGELYIGLNHYRGSGNKFINLSWFAEGGFLMFKSAAKSVYPEQPEALEDVRWAAAANQYFTSMIVPVVDPKADTATQHAGRGIGVWATRFPISAEKWNAARKSHTQHQLHGIDGALAMPGMELAAGQSVTRAFHIMAGPTEYRRLRDLDDYEDEILDFGFFGLISKGLLNSLNVLKGWLGSYWAAIIVLTIIIRSAMWPLQNRATATAKKMAALSPRLKELQERHKDDPMRMQQETSKLWKQYGINPLGGCLPMFAQIPIFFGFYNMLNKAVELRNNGFLWVKDLSQPDTITHIFGLPLNPLPLVMALTMLLQMKLSPKAGDPMQQRIMMFMPLIFIGLCYNYAAALALYWTVQNLFSIIQLYVTRDRNGAVEVIPPPQKPKK
jgi:YidC/Oxa1 family membrane protein insertase